MEIIDAQIHQVMPTQAFDPSLSIEQAMDASAELAVASMDAVGVAGAAVSSDFEHCRRYLARYPGRFVGVPWVARPKFDPEFPSDQFIDAVGATPGMVGIRLFLGTPDGSQIRLLQGGAYEPYFAAAERNGLAMFVTPHGFVPSLHPTIEEHPALTFVIDHLGLHTPPYAPPDIDAMTAVPDVLRLARYDNVVVKLTGVPSLSTSAYPFTDMWPLVHKYVAAFGVERLMWGSDFTRCKSLHTYREAVDFVLYTDELSAAEKQALLFGTICQWLSFPVIGSAPAPPASG